MGQNQPVMQKDQEERLLFLLAQYAGDRLTETEAGEMFDLLRLDGAKEVLEKTAEAGSNTGQPLISLSRVNWNRIWEKIEQAKGPAANKVIPIHKTATWLSVAAILLLMVAGTVYFLYNRNNEKPMITAAHYKGDVAPGHNGAVLHLSDGRTVVLDSASDGTVALQGNVRAVKENGALKYVGKTDEVVYNTITTGRGRQWQLNLPDGTKVCLNAASSIRYPLSFTGKEREVVITGEAYFEVKHKTQQPFRVKAGNRVIEDIGTAFNVNAYSDEPAIKTTLVEGSVKISAAMTLPSGSQPGGSIGQKTQLPHGPEVILKPGQQAIVVNDNIKVDPANMEQVLAWKNGFFGFDHADINTVMRQLARWYDVEVRFEGRPDNAPFQGKIGRGLTLAQVLKGLEQVHVHFRIEEDKRIVILP
jgi:ferric-dicitrate binding protein FerR (iron transport regulator)